jgi:hypothetical protein
VRDLSELPAGGGPATNVALDRSVVRFHSLYAVGLGGVVRKALNWGKSYATAIKLLVLFTVVGVWLSLRACEQSWRPAVQTGVVTWHFN